MSCASFPKDDHRACTDGKSFEKICGEATKRAKRSFASLGTCLTKFPKDAHRACTDGKSFEKIYQMMGCFPQWRKKYYG